MASISSGNINYCHLIEKCLESHPPSNYHQSLETQPCFNQGHDLGSQPTGTRSNSFPNVFNISNEITALTKKVFCMGYAL